jgi:hypothetical protein
MIKRYGLVRSENFEMPTYSMHPIGFVRSPRTEPIDDDGEQSSPASNSTTSS